MTNSSFLKRTIFALLALSAVFFVSCDDDFNLLGADVVGGDVHSDMIREIVDVVAYDRPAGAVQSNNMLQNQLGVYENPVFGKTVSNFVTQVVMASENPTLYEPLLDSVYLYIPYYSQKNKVDADGNGSYKWGDSYNKYIYGDTTATFKLELFRNGFYLRNSDPNATDNVQRYYSDDKQMVENMTVESLYSKSDFMFEPKETKIEAVVEGSDTPKLVERKEPGMLIYLNADRMKEIFLSDANKANLVNNTVFKDYFRGLYFKITQGNKAVMNMPRFSEGTITFKYRDYEAKTSGEAGPDLDKPRIRKTMTLNLKGNTINFFDNTYNGTYSSKINSSDANVGDDRLYLNGGAGSMAVIDLNADQIKALQSRYTDSNGNVLMNEANLVFYLDQAATASIGKAQIAPRVYLYDLKNKKPLIDYTQDVSKFLPNSKNDKYIHGGIMDTLKNADGTFDVRYKIRLTNHIKNIMKGDSTNVRLGLVVTDNINITTNYKLKTPFNEGSGETATEVKDIPYSSVQSPWGTILYGNNVPEGEQDKKIKLEIYYSKPKE